MALNINTNAEGLAKALLPGVKAIIDSQISKYIEEEVDKFKRDLKTRIEQFMKDDLATLVSYGTRRYDTAQEEIIISIDMRTDKNA